MSRPEHLYIFVLCPNNSGSTLLAQLLGTSPKVSILPTEGQWIAHRLAPGAMPFPEGTERRNWTSNEKKFADPSNYDWPRIKAAWRQAWDPEKQVLVEKSPPMVIAAPLLQEQFAPARFLLSVRNPIRRACDEGPCMPSREACPRAGCGRSASPVR